MNFWMNTNRGVPCEISEYIIFIKCTHHEWIYMSQTVYFEGNLNFDDFWLNLISCLDLVPKRQQMVGFGLDWGKWFRIVWHSCAGFECGIYNEFTARHSVSGRWYFKWAPELLSPDKKTISVKKIWILRGKFPLNEANPLSSRLPVPLPCLHKSTNGSECFLKGQKFDEWSQCWRLWN